MSQLFTNYDTSKIFVWNNRYATATYTNSSGNEVTIPAGRLLGRINSSNKVALHVSSATDGSEQPIGVAAKEYVVANGDSVTITYCIAGDVVESKLTLGGSDTLATIVTRTYTDSGTDTVEVASGTIRDLIHRNSQIILVSGTELTGTDNE